MQDQSFLFAALQRGLSVSSSSVLGGVWPHDQLRKLSKNRDHLGRCDVSTLVAGGLRQSFPAIQYASAIVWVFGSILGVLDREHTIKGALMSF